VQTVHKAVTDGYVARTCRKKIHFGAKYPAKFLLEKLEGDVRITLSFISKKKKKQQHVILRNE